MRLSRVALSFHSMDHCDHYRRGLSCGVDLLLGDHRHPTFPVTVSPLERSRHDWMTTVYSSKSVIGRDDKQ